MSGDTSPKKLEKIAKRLVRQDISAQTESMFFIDKEIFDEHFPEIKENIEYSSLSDLLLKYDLRPLSTAELTKVFHPEWSRKRSFAHLKHLSPDYGHHLCFMALRESASDQNENKNLIEKMKASAISRGKVPPSELFIDSPPSSDDDDIPRGQGEPGNEGQQHVTTDGGTHHGGSKHYQKLELEQGEYGKSIKCPVSANTITSKEEMAVVHTKPHEVSDSSEQTKPHEVSDDGKEQEPTESNNIKRSPDVSRSFPKHIDGCHCKLCHSISDPGPDHQHHAPPERLYSADSYTLKEMVSTNSTDSVTCQQPLFQPTASLPESRPVVSSDTS